MWGQGGYTLSCPLTWKVILIHASIMGKLRLWGSLFKFLPISWETLQGCALTVDSTEKTHSKTSEIARTASLWVHMGACQLATPMGCSIMHSTQYC